MGDSDKQSYMRGQQTLEINPYHPLIQELKLKARPCSAPELPCLAFLRMTQFDVTQQPEAPHRNLSMAQPLQRQSLMTSSLDT